MRKIVPFLVLLPLVACEKKLAGPTPVVAGVAPAAVCQQQLSTSVLISGEQLSPLLTGALNDGQRQLELPRVSLVPNKALDGSALSGSALVLPDDPKAPEASLVRWYDQQRMAFTVTPTLGVPVGLHDVVVENPQGAKVTLKEGLLAVPPPVLSASTPDLVCGEQECTVVLSGEGFIKTPTAQPVVTLGTVELPPTAMEECTALPGPAGYERCRALRLVIAADTLPFGTLSVRVTNPAPVGCVSSEPVTLTVVPKPTVTRIEADLVCVAEGENQLTVTGADFLTVDAVNPMLRFTAGAVELELPTTASNCVPVTGPAATVQKCATLTARLPQDALAPGVWDVTVTNPLPADCTSEDAITFRVVPPPVLTSIAPPLACNAQGAVTLTLTGTDFLTVGSSNPSVDVGGTVLTSSASNCTTLTGSSLMVQSCTTLTVQVPTTIMAGAQAVVVTNPDPAGCASAPSTLTLFAPPVVESVAPAGVCTTAGMTDVVVGGTGFLAITTGATRELPVVRVGTTPVAVTATGCVALTGLPGVEACASLHFQITGTTFNVNTYDVTVTNPEPVGCTSAAGADARFAVTPPPTITSVLPANLCAGGDTLQLTGTGFLSSSNVSLVAMGVTVPAAQVTVNGGGTQASATFVGGLFTGQYQLRLDNGLTCLATAPTPVTVIPGPQLFFADPEIVYNGLTVQATVYGTGFTLPVNSITLRPMDGGAEIPLTVQQASQTNRAQVLMRNADGGVLPAGTYAMTLDDGTNCNATLADAVQVVDQTSLALGEVQPPFGAQGMSTGITLTANLMGSNDAGFVEVPRVYVNPSNPGPGTVASPVGAVAYVDPATLTAVVPGTLPAGTYDVIVVNPDGRVGVKTQGFVVTALNAPPPRITSLSPGSLPNTGTSSLLINGLNFRAPLTVALRQCVDASSAPVASPSIAVTGTPTATSITASVSNVGSAAACVVRVTNTDNGTYADFSALVFTNPSKNLYGAINGPNLTVARRAPVALGGDATSAARFLYVAGGDTGNGAGLASVEVSTLSLIGVPGPFAVQRQGALNEGRSFAGGMRLGRWLYVAGGSDGTTRLNTVERASILDAERRGEVTDLLIEPVEGTGLSSGLYYYRVAAVMGASDAFNPSGEELASDPFPVRLPAVRGGLSFRVTVTWAAVPGAVRYRVFRSPVAAMTVGQEQVIAEVMSGTQFVDTGATPISSDRPLPVGTLSRWQTLAATLSVAREGPGVAAAIDPADATKAYLYVLGGRQTATTASNGYEYLPITLNTDGSQSPAAAFVSGGTNTLSSARWQLAAAAATNELSPRISAGQTFIYALSGITATGALASAPEGARVQAGGALETFISLPNLQRAGSAGVVAADQVFVFGGNQAGADSSISNGEICGSGNTAGLCSTNPTPPRVSNWNTGQAMNVARYLMGGSLHGAYIYIAGGVGSGGAALTSTEYRIW